jgi:hypothetical protein
MLARSTIVNHPEVESKDLREAINYLDTRHKDLNALMVDILKNFQPDELGGAAQLDYCVLGMNNTLIGKQYYLKFTNGLNRPDEYFNSFFEGIARILKVFW